MNVLLIGSSFSAMPMLAALKARSARVTVIGKYEADPCHAYGDASIYQDYSDADTLLRVCREEQFDYIVPTCNDYSYLAAAKVSAQLGYRGLDDLETTQIMHSKDHFRRFCADIGIPSPQILGVLERDTPITLTKLDGSALLKPVDSFSGRGIQIIDDIADLPAATEWTFEQSQRASAVLEEYVDGTLHSHTAFIAEGQIVWHDFIDEFCEVYPYQVDRSVYPSALCRDVRTEVQTVMETLVATLPLCDGLLHTQFMVSDTSFWIIECMRRCPGDLYGHHFKLALGYDYEAQYVAGFLGVAPRPPQTSIPMSGWEGAASPLSVERQVVSIDRHQAFFCVSALSGGREMFYIPLKNSGEPLGPAPFDKAGIIFFTKGQSPRHESKRSAEPRDYPGMILPHAVPASSS
ncbi:hypothetical protein [Cognatiyoonia sp. IB215182]|uniref:ATP-grasp domain-containing protein n=1 Tax=Cognatiyoonia sp. IB215182 TaxID=3097353 RepID=UPI002A0BCEC3|nr:hypothetical protein [Cognatiyoonia sp. IB215182]MDX8354711.1 hypothetical protein [Cognatiyoonia sp. IB215182]